MVKEHLLSAEDQQAHKLRNDIHTGFLLATLALVMCLCAFSLSGWFGVLIAIVSGALFFLIAPRMPGRMVMRMYRAQAINPQHGQEFYKIIQTLAERAELPSVPQLYVIPSATLNAFTTGSPNKAYIGITEGLLRKLELNEFAAVMAHEISHIRNNDLGIMSLADTMSRVTQLMSYAGLFLLVLNLPLLLLGEDVFPWFGVILLYLAPTISSLLQLALSRAREYDADLEAAVLIGDPKSLASALHKIENHQGVFWEDLLYPGRRIPQPSLLRSHPPTQNRIQRLLELSPKTEVISFPKNPMITSMSFGPASMHPRYHWPWPGIWY